MTRVLKASVGIVLKLDPYVAHRKRILQYTFNKIIQSLLL